MAFERFEIAIYCNKIHQSETRVLWEIKSSDTTTEEAGVPIF
jgi:hypothetical protein